MTQHHVTADVRVVLEERGGGDGTWCGAQPTNIEEVEDDLKRKGKRMTIQFFIYKTAH